MAKIEYENALAIFQKLIYNGQHFTISRTKDVEICGVCAGKGFTSKEELSDYHRREYNTYHRKCASCNGEGRFTVTSESLSMSYRSVGNTVKVPFSTDPITEPEGSDFELWYTINKPNK